MGGRGRLSGAGADGGPGDRCRARELGRRAVARPRRRRLTGQLIAALGVVVGAEVAVTAGPRSAERLRELGVAAVFDYHDGGWPAMVRDWAGGGGVAAAINAVPGGEAAALSTVADGGRLATITGAPPAAARGVTIVDSTCRRTVAGSRAWPSGSAMARSGFPWEGSTASPRRGRAQSGRRRRRRWCGRTARVRPTPWAVARRDATGPCHLVSRALLGRPRARLPGVGSLPGAARDTGRGHVAGERGDSAAWLRALQP